MSDMATSGRITVRVPDSLVRRLKNNSSLQRRPESALVREALEKYLEETSAPANAYDIAKASGLIGCLRRAPSDLSSNRKHFVGFGESR